MKRNINPTRRLDLMIGVLMAVSMLATAVPSSAATPPVGRTYFVVSLGLATDRAEAYEMGAGCLSFTRDEMCDTDGACGEWWLIEEGEVSRGQWLAGFDLSVIDDESGLPVEIVGAGRIDIRGPRSSFAAAAHGIEPTSGAKINFAVAGREVGANRCRRLVAAFPAARQ